MSSIDTNWRLPERLAELSTTSWPQAIHEWTLRRISILDPGEDSDHCLCGHFPIRHLCYLENQINHNTTIVGNHCVRLFTSDSAEESVFTSIPKIFDACERILHDKSRSANQELIQHAFNRGIFTQWEKTFYQDISRKRALSEAQKNTKTMLNNKLIHLLMLSPRAAYTRLMEHPREVTGPDLINLAHEQGKLTDHEWRHYRNNWEKVGDRAINPDQIALLNLKIIEGLRDKMGILTAP
jgi:hypothetical protein